MDASREKLQAYLYQLGFRRNSLDGEVRFHDPATLPRKVHEKAIHAPEECLTRNVFALRDATALSGTMVKKYHRGSADQGQIYETTIQVTGSSPAVVVEHFYNRYPMPGHYKVRSMDTSVPGMLTFAVEVPQSGITRHYDIFIDQAEIRGVLGEEVTFDAEPLGPYLEEGL